MHATKQIILGFFGAIMSYHRSGNSIWIVIEIIHTKWQNSNLVGNPFMKESVWALSRKFYCVLQDSHAANLRTIHGLWNPKQKAGLRDSVQFRRTGYASDTEQLAHGLIGSFGGQVGDSNASDITSKTGSAGCSKQNSQSLMKIIPSSP